jgi:5-methylcytosine-specific restriction protein A
MALKQITSSALNKAINIFNTTNIVYRKVDWHIVENNKLYPLKEIYRLSINDTKCELTTEQMKLRMKDLNLEYIKNKDKSLSDFEKRVNKAIKDKNEDRQIRLSNIIKKPTKSEVIYTVYNRNPDVIAQVLIDANGKCNKCKKHAPFNRKTNGTPYLEVHHKLKLSDGGDDTIENAEALCPNCHREKHFG